MSFSSVVAHMMGLQLSGFAQLPFLAKGCTRFAQSGCEFSGMSALRMAMSQRHAAACLFTFTFQMT